MKLAYTIAAAIALLGLIGLGAAAFGSGQRTVTKPSKLTPRDYERLTRAASEILTRAKIKHAEKDLHVSLSTDQDVLTFWDLYGGAKRPAFHGTVPVTPYFGNDGQWHFGVREAEAKVETMKAVKR